MNSPTVIANDALALMGAKAITDIDGTDASSVLCKQYYDSSWIDVLGAYPWKETIKRASPTAGTVEDYDFYDYQFVFPSDFVDLITVFDDSGTEITAFEQRGNFIYTDEETVYIEYISSSGILLDTYATGTTYIPIYVQHLASILIASKIAFRITQNESLMQTLYQEYKIELKQAQIKNMPTKGSGGETYWGN